MTAQGHVDQLIEKHTHLEHDILEEMHRPQPDSLKLTDLKRQKLRLKEEISRLQHQH